MNDDLLAALLVLQSSLLAFRLALSEFAMLEHGIGGEAGPRDVNLETPPVSTAASKGQAEG